jgi:hypothetical protein
MRNAIIQQGQANLIKAFGEINDAEVVVIQELLGDAGC